MSPSLLYILKGDDGSDLLAMDAVWEDIEAKPVYFASPVVVEIEPQRPFLFFQTSQRIITAMVRSDGALAWRDGPGTSPDRTEPAIGDFSGTKRSEILSVGFDDGARCYDAATGEIGWTLPFGEKRTVTGGLSADIDSDGKDEAVFAIGPTLVCLACEPGAQGGFVRWKLDFPCDVGPPSFVDLEGSGKGTLLIVGSNGKLYGVR
jgi:hypothetical protein